MEYVIEDLPAGQAEILAGFAAADAEAQRWRDCPDGLVPEIRAARWAGDVGLAEHLTLAARIARL